MEKANTGFKPNVVVLDGRRRARREKAHRGLESAKLRDRDGGSGMLVCRGIRDAMAGLIRVL